VSLSLVTSSSNFALLADVIANSLKGNDHFETRHHGVSRNLFHVFIETLPRGVHLFCMPKINEPNKKAPDIALIPKIKLD
jgi:hypothetical protein